MSKLNNRELAQIKRIAQNVDADYQKVCKLNEKIAELTKQKEELQQSIDEQEAPVIRKTGGYKSTELYEKVIIPQVNDDGTPKVDKEGRQIKTTKYILRYPETIVPVVKINVVGEVEDSANTESFGSAVSPLGSDYDLDAMR